MLAAIIERPIMGSTHAGNMTPPISAANGDLLIYELTTRAAAELPPSLYGCHFTMRVDVTTPGTDIMQDVIPIVRDGLTPELAAMPGPELRHRRREKFLRMGQAEAA